MKDNEKNLQSSVSAENGSLKQTAQPAALQVSKKKNNKKKIIHSLKRK